MGIQLWVISGYRKLPTNCNDTHTDLGGERTPNFLSDAATNVVGTARNPHVLKRSMKNGMGLAPFQKFHIDLTGPYRWSSGGHVYLLTGICCLTEYLVVVPLKNKSAVTVGNALLKHVYLIYGAVELQVHDNGPEFVNSILGHLARMMGIQDLRSTLYRPVANSAIERTHRTINAVFAKTIKEHQKIGMNKPNMSVLLTTPLNIHLRHLVRST